MDNKLATKEDLWKMKEEFRNEISFAKDELREEMSTLKVELRGEIVASANSLEQKLNQKDDGGHRCFAGPSEIDSLKNQSCKTLIHSCWLGVRRLKSVIKPAFSPWPPHSHPCNRSSFLTSSFKRV